MTPVHTLKRGDFLLLKEKLHIEFAKCCFVIIVFFLLLLLPSALTKGCLNGILLWGRSIIPILFPLLLCMNYLQRTHGFEAIVSRFLPRKMKNTTKLSCLILMIGLCCGCPLGSVLLKSYMDHNGFPAKTASMIAPLCSMLSPGFIIGYVYQTTIWKGSSLLLFLFCIYGPVICCSFFSLILIQKKHSAQSVFIIEAPKEFDSFSNIIDDTVLTIIYIGTYIAIFSIVLELCKAVPVLQSFHGKLFMANLEVTNGIQIISSLKCSDNVKKSLLVFVTSFGGCSILSQIKGILATTGISFRVFCLKKLIIAFSSAILSMLLG